MIAMPHRVKRRRFPVTGSVSWRGKRSRARRIHVRSFERKRREEIVRRVCRRDSVASQAGFARRNCVNQAKRPHESEMLDRLPRVGV